MRTLPVVLVAASIAACTSDPPADSCARGAIIDGTPYDGDPSIVMITIDGEFDCSGSVIHPGAVLTARHCVEDEMTGEPYPIERMDIRVGAAFDGATVVARVVDAVTTEGYLDGQDIAVVILDHAIDLPVYSWKRDGDLADGLQLVGIGYGLTMPLSYYGPEPEEPVRKHRSTTAIADHMDSEFLTTTSISCYGDSGGPALDPEGRIVGVVSRGTDDFCRGQSIYTRPDAFADLIDRALMQAPQLTAPATPDASVPTPDAAVPVPVPDAATSIPPPPSLVPDASVAPPC